MSSACVLKRLVPQVVQLRADDCSRRELLELVVASLRRVRVGRVRLAGRPEPRRSFDAGALRTFILVLERRRRRLGLLLANPARLQ